ncbi:MAG: GspE/PulE family protein [bacterium]
MNEDIFSIISFEYASKHRIVPLEAANGILKLGCCTSINPKLIKELEFLTGKSIDLVQMTGDEVSEKIKSRYNKDHLLHTPEQSGSGEFTLIEKEYEDENKKVKDEDQTSVIQLVNKIITNAIDYKASDIHIEAYEEVFRIRYRLDGVLHEEMELPSNIKKSVISRFKIMADLDIAEKRRPQDGRIRVKRGEKNIDLRVSTLPTDFGEKVVLRILDKSSLNLDLQSLGFNDKLLSLVKKMITLPYGMILVTGPTGSGKTTTLYATLNYLNTDEVNILTVEDPIEYNLSGINQSQVRYDIGYNFPNALRSFLRQDPDIIMVGEIRDADTAEIAVRAALTGHLVLSTLHTNSAPETITRLIDMQQEPFLISSSVKLIIAQRLVRIICKNCKVVDKSQESRSKLRKIMGYNNNDITLYQGKGCETCNYTGYAGRTAIFEVMVITKNIAKKIHTGVSTEELFSIARDEGMNSLQQSGIEKLKAGITTVEEVLRTTEF